MKKKEIKARIAELVSNGINKQQVFDQLSGQGVKDSVLAQMVASQKDLLLCERHSRKVSILISLTLVQAVLAALQGFIIGVGPRRNGLLPLCWQIYRCCLPGGFRAALPVHAMLISCCRSSVFHRR